MYRLAECLLIKDENRYLVEHLERNAAAGVEHFYIYDNESAEPVSDYLRRTAPQWLEKCTIERFAPERGQDIQVLCYNVRYLYDHRGESVWTAYIDTDELLTGKVSEVLDKADTIDATSISITPFTHGCNGHLHDGDGTLFDRFGQDARLGGAIKTITRNKYVDSQAAHRCKMIGQYGLTVESNADFALHHFVWRSYEEWLAKVKRGAASGRTYYKDMWLSFNRISASREALAEIEKKFKL